MEYFFAKWQQKLSEFCDRLCDRVAAYMECKEIEQHSFREFALEDELNSVKLDKKFLQLQLTKTRADLFELERKPQKLREDIAKIFLMSDENLRKTSQFPVRKPEAGSGWETVTGFCCLGGCDLDAYPFQSERDALLFAALLKAVGYQPPHNLACSDCYKEYMTEKLGGIEPYAE